jgi:hypothetical protein
MEGELTLPLAISSYLISTIFFEAYEFLRKSFRSFHSENFMVFIHQPVHKPMVTRLNRESPLPPLKRGD